jgi:hypothetical protein
VLARRVLVVASSGPLPATSLFPFDCLHCASRAWHDFFDSMLSEFNLSALFLLKLILLLKPATCCRLKILGFFGPKFGNFHPISETHPNRLTNFAAKFSENHQKL